MGCSGEIEFLRKRGMQVGIGVHPKARIQHPDQWRNFNRALYTPGVVALGEIGLVFAGPSPSTQEVRFENILLRLYRFSNMVLSFD